MKGLSERIVLAAIILSCGIVMQLGSTAGNAVRDRQVAKIKKQGKQTVGWLPGPRQLRTLAATPSRPQNLQH